MPKHGVRHLALSILASALLVGTANAVTYTVNVTLTGGQEIPANGSTAVGTGTLTIDTAANTIGYNIVHNAASPTAAHIHGAAARDKSAGVLIGFPNGNSPMVGTLNYTSVEGALEAVLIDGRTYVNVHTAAFSAGEIRGQVPAAPATAPGVSEWGLMVLATGLVIAGTVLVARRRRSLA